VEGGAAIGEAAPSSTPGSGMEASTLYAAPAPSLAGSQGSEDAALGGKLPLRYAVGQPLSRCPAVTWPLRGSVLL
jgi:hypothetical protein